MVPSADMHKSHDLCKRAAGKAERDWATGYGAAREQYTTAEMEGPAYEESDRVKGQEADEIEAKFEGGKE